MQTGGRRKTDFEYIVIEGEDAVARFEATFGRDPYRESCECCDADFAVSSYRTLRQATACARNCRYDETRDPWVEAPGEGADAVEPLEEFLDRPEVRVIRDEG
jgi:hypothetical protein